MTDPRTLWVDFSWLLFKNWHGGANLSITEEGRDEDGNPYFVDRPTQHVFGTVQNLMQAAFAFNKVVLALDGGKEYRRNIFPGYKAGRKEVGFPIFDDQMPIVRMASHFPNVSFCRIKGYDADDLISSAMKTGESLVMWTRDRDLMQTPGDWAVLDNLNGGQPSYIDLPAYLEKETEMAGMTFMPCWYKTIRGDSSDKIPPSIPGIRLTKIEPLIRHLSDTQDFEVFKKYFQKTIVWKHPVDWDKVYMNYRLVMPRYLTPEQSETKRYTPAPGEVQSLLQYYRFNSLMPYFS